jgi:hypothetical protein
MNNTVTLGGTEYNAAPLKTLQVASFYDSLDAAGDKETRTSALTRTLRTIAQSLKNSGSPLVEGLTDEQAIEKINDVAKFSEIDPSFSKVLEISGLRKEPEGEAPAAAESTSSDSSAA